jgi:ketosteroid isomerase-like protein
MAERRGPFAFLVAFAALMALAAPAAAGDVDDIRNRLEQWTDAFNAGEKDGICDLFSKRAIADFRGQPERHYDEICALLHDSLDDPARNFHYGLEIHEIIVEGDLAVVRLTWTLFISPLNVTTVEQGMDVFRHEADGKWRIIRYLAYEE